MHSLWYAGIDVSCRTLDVSMRDTPSRHTQAGKFENTAEGYRKLIRWLTKRGRQVRVVLESTGIYSLDVSLALHGSKGIAVMVVNPQAARKFADAQMQRSSTDATMAVALQEFCARMEFVPWVPPAEDRRALRDLSRRIAALTTEKTRELNRLHATDACEVSSAAVRKDLDLHVAYLEQRIEALEQSALELIRMTPDLKQAHARVVSTYGIADTSAIQLLGELLVLPADMTARQWVAHCGLDVRAVTSGTSVHKKPRISKKGNARVRRALYMPALVAIQGEPHVRAFYEQLLAAGKARLQAVVAVMRKLLHSIYGMLKTNTDFDGAKFRILPTPISA
jgi:transposase